MSWYNEEGSLQKWRVRIDKPPLPALTAAASYISSPVDCMEGRVKVRRRCPEKLNFGKSKGKGKEIETKMTGTREQSDQAGVMHVPVSHPRS